MSLAQSSHTKPYVAAAKELSSPGVSASHSGTPSSAAKVKHAWLSEKPRDCCFIFSFSFCSPDPVFCLLPHLHLNPCFYLISLLSPILAVLIPKQTNKQNTSKSGRFSPTWALHHLSIWCSTETFPCVFLLSVLWSLPSETCLPSWELMLRAGN